MSSLSTFQPSLRSILAILCLPAVVYLAFGASACASAEGSGDTSLIVRLSADDITIQNGTGVSLVKGEVSIIPDGENPRPFTMIVPSMSAGETRSFRVTSFRSADGQRFIGKVAKGKLVRVSVRDAAGTLYEREVPFE